ncbi:hypothetical protein AAHA92_33276 [Salvia divinorum]|uniref:Uncharacterized protein n=1 Tax=Salvia divinorum TaxID=28513 RepID=A0ABD1FRQ1_SALDI
MLLLRVIATSSKRAYETVKECRTKTQHYATASNKGWSLRHTTLGDIVHLLRWLCTTSTVYCIKISPHDT